MFASGVGEGTGRADTTASPSGVTVLPRATAPRPAAADRWVSLGSWDANDAHARFHSSGGPLVAAVTLVEVAGVAVGSCFALVADLAVGLVVGLGGVGER